MQDKRHAENSAEAIQGTIKLTLSLGGFGLKTLIESFRIAVCEGVDIKTIIRKMNTIALGC